MDEEDRNIPEEDDLGQFSGSVRQLIEEKDEMSKSNQSINVFGKGKNALSDNYMEIRCGKLLKNLKFLDLTGKIVEKHLGRRLGDDDLTHICSFLVKNKAVIYVSLGYNLITGDGFSYLAHYLAEDSSLQALNLCQNEIHSISEGVLRNTAPLWKLKCLLLRGNKLGPKSGLVLGKMLRYNDSLAHLDIGETDQTIQSVSHIVQSLLPCFDGNSILQKLHLNRIVPASQHGFAYSSHLCRFVDQLLTNNVTLVELHLEKNEISDWDLELVIPALAKNKVLELINLTGNRLTSHGMELLATALPESRIQYLMVSSNRIGDEGATALGKVFSKTKIRYLDISRNKITDLGIKNLLWGMEPRFGPLHALFLFGNPITTNSVRILQEQIYMGHLSPSALDIKLTYSKGEIDFSEDSIANKYRNLYFFVNELISYNRQLHHSCCYLPPNKETVLPYRKLLPP